MYWELLGGAKIVVLSKVLFCEYECCRARLYERCASDGNDDGMRLKMKRCETELYTVSSVNPF